MAQATHRRTCSHRWLAPIFRPVHLDQLPECERLAYQQFLLRARWFTLLKALLNGLFILLFLLHWFPRTAWPALVFLVDGLLLVPYSLWVRRWPALSTILLLTLSAVAITAVDWLVGRPRATTDALYALLIVAGAALLVHLWHIAVLTGLISLAYLLPLPFALRTPGSQPGKEALQTASIHILAFVGLGAITGVLTRLYQRLLEMRSRQNFLTAVLAGLQEIASGPDLQAGFQRIAERAVQAIPAVDRALLLVVEGNQLVIRGAVGYPGVPLLGLRFPADCVRQHHAPVSLEDIFGQRRRHLPAEALTALHNLLPTLSSLLLPLRGWEGPLGLLIVASTLRRNAFNEETRRQLGLFAQQAAIALQNARLVDRLQQSLQELEQKTQELRLRQDELREFIAAISQRLQGPVAALAGFVHLLHDSIGDRLSPEEQDYLQRIERNSAWMDSLVQEMLFLARLDSMAEEREPMALTTLIQGVATHLQLERQGITVSVPDGLPFIHADPVVFWHLFSNLLKHACRLLPPDGPRRIDVRYQEVPGAFRLGIHCAGVRLSPEEQNRLFDLFPWTQDGGADGPLIGLWISRRVVQRYNGQCWVESGPEGGTSFCLLLPAEQPYGEGSV